MTIETTQTMSEKDMVQAMIKRINGGDDEVKRVLSMSDAQYNNRKYQLQNQRFKFEHLLIIQQLSGTTLLSQFCAPEGYVLVEEPCAEELDKVELFDLLLNENATRGNLDLTIKRALADGKLSEEEMKQIIEAKKEHIQALETSTKAYFALYSK